MNEFKVIKVYLNRYEDFLSIIAFLEANYGFARSGEFINE